MRPEQGDEARVALDRALELATALEAELVAIEYGDDAPRATLRFWAGTRTNPRLVSDTLVLKLVGPAMDGLRRKLGLAP